MPYFALMFAMLVWGISFIVTSQAIKTFPFMLFINLRFILASGILWGLLLARKKSVKIAKKDLKKMLFLFMVQPVGYFAFETLGLKFTDPSNVSLILSLAPIFTMIWESRINQEKLNLSQKVGVFFTVLATALFIWYDRRDTGLDFSFIGEGFAVLASLSASFYVLLSRNLSDRYSPLQQTTFQFTFASLFFLPFSLPQASAVAHINLNILFSLLFLVVFCTVIAFLSISYALKHIQSSKVSSLLNLIPMITVIAAGIYGKEITLWHMAFMGMAVTGTWIANRKQKEIVNIEY
jgi:drug/metabolite transporter (DMT)-like permease